MAMEDSAKPLDVIREEMIGRAFQERTILPARVLSYARDPRPTVSVRVSARIRNRPVDGGASEFVSRPILEDVPVMRMEFGPWVLDGHIERGDDGLLLVCDRDIDEWIGVGGEYNPGSPRIRDIRDALFLPMMRPDSLTSGQSADRREFVITDKIGDTQIVLNSDTKKVQVNATLIELNAAAGVLPGPYYPVGVREDGTPTHVAVAPAGGGPIVWTPIVSQITMNNP